MNRSEGCCMGVNSVVWGCTVLFRVVQCCTRVYRAV